MGIYGVVSNVAHGHVSPHPDRHGGMLFTAVSYGRMARVFQPRLSLHYVGRSSTAARLCGRLVHAHGLPAEPNHLRHLCSAAARNVLPVPFAAWAVAFVVVFTALNLRGVQTSGRVNALLAIAMSIVVVIFLAEAIRYIALVARRLGSVAHTFYDPTTFSTSRLFRGTSIACSPTSLRRHLDHVGGSGKSPRNIMFVRFHLPHYRHPVSDRGLRGATGVAYPHSVCS